jgi:acetolactate synthase I/II/III large subunit
MPAVADLIVHRLRDAGVKMIFGVPGGGSNLDLLDAATRAGLSFVLTSTESGAMMAAIAQAEIAHAPGVCLTTLGPGAASAVNGVACAYLDRAPVLVFTDSHPAAARECTHQRIDHQRLFAPIAKQSVSLTAGNADDAVRQALTCAMTPPLGPVHLDCPGDVLSCSATALAARSVAAHRSADLSAGALAEVEAFALPLSARRPLLLVGLGARQQADADAIRAFCERRSVPAMVTYKAKGVVPDDDAWFAGVLTNASIERPLLEEADLLIGIGLDPVELIPRPWTAAAPIVFGGPFPVETGHVPFEAQLVADVPAVMRALDAALPSSGWKREAIRATLNEQRSRIAPAGGGFTAQRVIEMAAGRLASMARVTVDAGAHMFPATTLWPICEPNGLLISNGLSTMGFALPAAIGAALLDRARPVVALTGDGGLLMCVGELATAAREHLDIITIVFADEALSLIGIKQTQRGLAPAGVGLGRVEWTKLAEGFGVTAFTAGDEAALDAALEQASAAGGPCLIEARIDASNYGRTLRAVRG